MTDKNKKDFIEGDATSEFDVYYITRKVYENNKDSDYYELNDLVHDAVKAKYNYTHALRKNYQYVIRNLMVERGLERGRMH